MKLSMMKKISFAILLMFFAKVAFAQEVVEAPSQDSTQLRNVAILQGLNKSTAKVSILELKVGQEIQFGNISIIAHKCWKAPLDQRPENKILLEVSEKKAEGKKRIFYGWMMSSSPSISGMEHPIYDVIAMDCK
jgi:hypothetical protein